MSLRSWLPLGLLGLLLVSCVGRIPDVDGDGYSTDEGDCDDTDPAVNPGVAETCNDIDDDCSGAPDDIDEDGDGSSPCGGPPDCNDASAIVFPGNVEECDGVDNDCNGVADDGFDEDEDTFTTCEGDCDDGAPLIHPEAMETCNEIDDDCDEQVDEGFDQDGDGVRTCDSPPDCNDNHNGIYPGADEQCDGQDWNCDGIAGNADLDSDGYAECNGDCDDGQGAINPGATEECNSADDDCDGQIDEDFDLDGDGWTSCGGDCADADWSTNPDAAEECDGLDQDCDTLIDEDFDADGDGFTTCSLPVPDCDDGNAAINPDAEEVCDGLDNNCSFQLDEGFDADFDGWAPCVGDCDDSNPVIHPDAPEQCNTIDDDCDGLVDEGFDNDADGFDVCAGDCDDDDATVYPDAPELCDALDNDCDGVPDEDFDLDFDGVSTCAIPPDCNDNVDTVFPGALESCDGYDSDCNGYIPPIETDGDLDGQPPCLGDCDDADPLNFEGNPEVCDGQDNGCDGTVDEGFDADGDGVLVCGPDAVLGTPDDDCDDDDPNNAGTFTEVCDGADNDCDGVADNGFDVDGDGVTTCQGDCDDNDPATWPGAEQGCTSADNDCDGVPGDLDEDGDGSLICEDCDDADPDIFPGAGFTVCDGTDWNCDGIVEDEVVVAFLPGQVSSWLDLPALVDLEAESAGYSSCTLVFEDVAPPVTEAELVAIGAHIALISSPGEGCEVYDAGERAELQAWLDGIGRGVAITGTLGDAGCGTYTDRYELGTLVGVTLSTMDPGTANQPIITRTAGWFWTDISAASFTSGASMVADGVLGLCTGAAVDALVGDSSVEPLRQVVAYTANPAAPCLSGVPMDHKGAWLPFQPEDGGDLTDRVFLYNVLDWLKE